MGFWKNVSYDIQYHGMSKEAAIKVNADLKYSKNKEKAINDYNKAVAIAEANKKINTRL